ncbi:hypothetical protein POM88_034913 [Heracleum sosnowskyi]|uniref:mRNA export factor GLE1 n=1 Tax=Heracleum sosnowskyi TaxID=360622 RepID=A0AAD8MCT4_9APIA|nr:hypothetical protein POM88_034913 [Heracleum sosnowskyi]
MRVSDDEMENEECDDDADFSDRLIGVKKATSLGTFLKGAESALKLEEQRSEIFKEVAAETEALRRNMDLRSHEMQIARRIRQISGTTESVRGKAIELVTLISNSSNPRSSIAMFAEKMVSQCVNPSGSFSKYVYAYAQVVVLSMHIHCSKVYELPHGIEEGWAWIARFFNALPANLYTAVSLRAFLEMAGFALYRRYKSQFKKILNIVSRKFVSALEQQEDLANVVMNIKVYKDSSKFLEEPDGRRMQSSLLSSEAVPEPNHGGLNHHNTSNRELDRRTS